MAYELTDCPNLFSKPQPSEALVFDPESWWHSKVPVDFPIWKTLPFAGFGTCKLRDPKKSVKRV